MAKKKLPIANNGEVVYDVDRTDVAADLKTQVITISCGEDSARINLTRDAARHLAVLLSFWYVGTANHTPKPKSRKL